MKIKGCKPFWYVFVFGLILLADRITKIIAVRYFLYEERALFPGLTLTCTWNRGIAWGFFRFVSTFGYYALFLLISTVIVIFAYYTYDRYKQGEPILFEIFILSGALSNYFDRVMYGGVIDFIDCHISNWHWPSFNIADAFIVAGVVGVIGRTMYDEFYRKN